ncbi:MAG: NAD(P)/FAD-dependent oxidoreductase [Solirubrobacterales bacterium]|nr:NAD(P)/FAD-dependent oxidoreductase [Solirubrobacterales bacterium]
MADDRDRSGHFDVLIIGAGLSGIGAAYQLQSELPGKTYALLESRESMGGTWDFFNYPGFRSDTDMQTLGYRFRPWTEGKAVADGPSILRYIKETAREGGVDRHIRYNHRAERAEWSTDDAQWTVTASRGDSGETAIFTCSFLYVCSGYYRYDEGYSPEFAGTSRFEGPIIHPHRWPDDLDYTGKRVVIVGSGATAVTLVPAMAPDAAHVTMLQRSPSYVIRIPLHDRIANRLRRLAGDRFSYLVTRWKNIFIAIAIYQLSRRRPRMMRRWLRAGVERSLPEGYDVDTHFNPDYEPWDQRLCMVPDGDLFKAISNGSASVVTDRIETFTEKGLKLESGRELEADIVVTATGFDLLAFGGIEFNVDGRDISLPDTFAYKGLMLSGLPNYAYTLGYTNAPFTLKADLVAQYVCRLLTFMDERDLDICVPINDDPTVGEARLLDFEAGYVKRSEHLLPKAGSREPWRLGMSYVHDLLTLRHRPISDGALRFSRKPEPAVSRDRAHSA